jgi:NCS1 family nucleobase:cation symporter-1
MVKIIIMPIFGITLFVWSVSQAKGFGPLFVQGTKSSTTNPAGMIFFTAMSSAIAPKATLALNIADFTRYAKSPKVVVWTNIISLTLYVSLFHHCCRKHSTRTNAQPCHALRRSRCRRHFRR